MKLTKKICLLLLAFLICAAAVSCGSRRTTKGGGDFFATTDQNGSMPESTETQFDYGWNAEESAEAPDNTIRSTKMIYQAHIDMETLAFDEAASGISALVAEANGYFEEKNVSGYSSGYRYAEYTVRVPTENFSTFCAKVGDLCHITRSSENAENITESYYDTESRLTTARTKLTRLQELLAQAEDMEDIITIENAISDTEQTIDYLSGTLRSYDSLVDYATVYISLNEVYKLSGTKEAPLTLGQKLVNAFDEGLESIGEFFEEVLIFLAHTWFWLLLLAVIVFVVIRAVRRRQRGRKALAPKKKETAETPNDKQE